MNMADQQTAKIRPVRSRARRLGLLFLRFFVIGLAATLCYWVVFGSSGKREPWPAGLPEVQRGFLEEIAQSRQANPLEPGTRLAKCLQLVIEGKPGEAWKFWRIPDSVFKARQITLMTRLLNSAGRQNFWQVQELILKDFEELPWIQNPEQVRMNAENWMQLLAGELRTGESYDALWDVFLELRAPRALADWVAKPLLAELDTRGLDSAIRQAFNNDPDFAWVQRAQGLLLWTKGDFAKAAEHLQKTANHFENDPQGRFALAESLLSLGKQVRPEAVMGPPPEQSACPDVQTGRYQLYLGRLWEARSEWQKAQACYEKSLAANPAEVEAAVRLGQAAMRNGQMQLANSSRKYAESWKKQFDTLRRTHTITADTRYDELKYQELAAVCESIAIPKLDPGEDAELLKIITCSDFHMPYAQVAAAWKSLGEFQRVLTRPGSTGGARFSQLIQKTMTVQGQGELYRQPPQPLLFQARPSLKDNIGVETMDQWIESVDSVGSGEIQFQERTIPGLDFSYQSFQTDQLRIADTMGGGVGVIDFDGDGWMDLYFPNGCSLAELATGKPSANNRLFKNIKGERFEDVTTKAGVAGGGYGMGVAVGDYNGDGHCDMLVTGYGNLILYKNRGNGTFEDATKTAGLKCNLWSTAAAFADLDQDGDEDLVVVTYVDAPLGQPERCVDQLNHLIHCTPAKFPAQPDMLWENLGDGTFLDISESSGIATAENGRGLGLAVADLDEDGRLDLFVANDASPNFYFHNEGGLKFREMANEAGLAVDGSGKATASMGVVADDLDEDGLIDLFHTNFINEPNTFRKNLGGGLFLDGTLGANLSASSLSKTGFGTSSFDADLDGHVDIFITNGHVDDKPYIQTPMKQPPLFYQGLGQGKYALIPEKAFPYIARPVAGRGLASCDINNDGLVDLIMIERDHAVTVLKNESNTKNQWIGLDLRDATGKTPAGVKIQAKFEGQTRTRWITPGTSYLAAQDERVVIGLGSGPGLDELQIVWPALHGKPAKTQSLKNLGLGRYHRVQQGP